MRASRYAGYSTLTTRRFQIMREYCEADRAYMNADMSTAGGYQAAEDRMDEAVRAYIAMEADKSQKR